MGVYRKNEAWWIDYYVEGVRKRERIGRNRRFAERMLEKRRAAIIEGRFVDRRKDRKLTLRRLAEQYIEYSKRNKRSWERDVASCKHLVAHFGERQLRAITPESVERYKKKRMQERPRRGSAPKMSPASINRELAALSAMFSWAEVNGWIDGNPVRKVKKLREANERDRILSETEFRALVDAAAPHLKPILLIAYHTGMRKGEILALTWDRIDLARRVIRLRGGDTKSDQARIAPLNEEAMDALRTLPPRVGSPWVFRFRGKRPVGSVKRAFANARIRAGLKDVHLHDLRHTFVTNARRAGVDHLTIMAITGHRTTAVFKRYNTIEEADVLEASRRIEEYRALESRERRGGARG